MRRAALFGPLLIVLLVAPSVFGSNAPKSDPAQDPQVIYITFLDPKLELRGQVSNVSVQFNPTELGLKKTVPWGHHDPAGNSPPHLEFTHGKPHSLNFTLFFDGFESQTDVSAMLAKLERFVVLGDAHRPPLVHFEWGDFGAFEGVIASINVKYTMFLEDGTPCRASADIEFTQAERARLHNETRGNETRH